MFLNWKFFLTWAQPTLHPRRRKGHLSGTCRWSISQQCWCLWGCRVGPVFGQKPLFSPCPVERVGNDPRWCFWVVWRESAVYVKRLITWQNNSAQLHSSRKKMLSPSLPVDASSLLAPLSLLLPAASSSSLQSRLLPFMTASAAIWGPCYYTYQSRSGCGLCK